MKLLIDSKANGNKTNRLSAIKQNTGSRWPPFSVSFNCAIDRLEVISSGAGTLRLPRNVDCFLFGPFAVHVSRISKLKWSRFENYFVSGGCWRRTLWILWSEIFCKSSLQFWHFQNLEDVRNVRQNYYFIKIEMLSVLNFVGHRLLITI